MRPVTSFLVSSHLMVICCWPGDHTLRTTGVECREESMAGGRVGFSSAGVICGRG